MTGRDPDAVAPAPVRLRASRVMKARRESLCLMCWQPIRPGDYIGKTPRGWCHVACIVTKIREVTT